MTIVYFNAIILNLKSAGDISKIDQIGSNMFVNYFLFYYL